MGMNVIGFLLYKLDNLRLNYMGKKNTFSVNNRGGGNWRASSGWLSVQYYHWGEFIY